MTYLALNQGVAEWLLPKMGVLDALNEYLPAMIADDGPLTTGAFAEGPVLITRDTSGQILVILHADYSSGTGEEAWGFIKLSGEMSLTSHLEIAREVLEREIYVISQRLRGLLIDGAYFHRKYEDGTHTLLAGRGSQARHYSIAYAEGILFGENFESRSIVCVGPQGNFVALRRAAEAEGRNLGRLGDIANSFIAGGRAATPLARDVFPALRSSLEGYGPRAMPPSGFANVELSTTSGTQESLDSLRTLGFSYDQWISADSPLNDNQRRILNSHVLDQHPLRIVGAAGSGKTLLMQLLVMKMLKDSVGNRRKPRIIYIAHSEAMKDKVARRFEILNGSSSVLSDFPNLEVTTLAEYCRVQLQLEIESILERDAADAKAFQLEQVTEAIRFHRRDAEESGSALLRGIFGNDELLRVFAWLTVAEISISIKGHGLENDKKRYVESERRLSRFHGVLSFEERAFLFEVFRTYHHEVFETYAVLDPDDIALSLAGRLRTPVWELRRREEGFDYVFVDEAQLFNGNERRVLPLLTKGNTDHVPLALALDEAQSFYGVPSAGLATLGIKDISNENLASIHRSTTAITKLAFFIIQRSTDLFGPEFPDFSAADGFIEADQHPLSAPPRIEAEGAESRSFGKFVLRRVRELRRENVRQIAIICHAEQYWGSLESELARAELPLQILRERGERIKADQPVVVLCRPAQVGGQEFDAVVIVGLELGVVPPTIRDNDALASAVEQQSIREIYLSVSRARYRVVFVLSKDAGPNAILTESIRAGLLAN